MKKIVPIFSGGGTRLSAHIGILDALNDLNITFEHIVGVSGGSIVSSLYCTGMPSEEIKSLAEQTNFKQFKGFSMLTLVFQGGLSTGDKFEEWMDEKLHGKTFSDINHQLSIVATDVNGGGPVIFSRKNTPNLKISKAVRFSMSIPLFFSFKTYKEHILVDGAILSEDALYQDWAEDGTQVICFRLKSEQVAVSNFKKGWFPIKQYVMMLIKTFMTAMSREYVHDQFWKNTVVVKTGTLSPVDFSLNVEQKEQLYNSGYETAYKYVPMRMDKVNATCNLKKLWNKE